MISRRSIYFWYFVLTLVSAFLFANGHQHSVAMAEGSAVIGTGTAASCQSNAAVNQLTDAVLAGGVIDFNCGPDPVIILVNTLITNQNVTVNGDGLIILSGEDLRQVFYVMTGGSATLNDLVLTDGSASKGGALAVEPNASAVLNRTLVSSSQSSGDGGGIYNYGTLTVNHSTIGSNIAGLNGGGVFNNNGTVTINDSYLISNQAQSGGGVYTVNGQLTLNRTAVRSSFINNQGGGIFAAGPTQITNSTFSNNRALKGGALFLIHNVDILNSTFNENKADLGGAIWKEASSSSTLKNSILTGSENTSGGSSSLNCDGPSLTSLGRNIISDGSCLDNPGSNGDKFNTDPDLGIWFGSPIRGYIPNPNSPVIDYGLGCPSVDQRGYPRPLGGACDVGSMEFGALVFLPSVIH